MIQPNTSYTRPVIALMTDFGMGDGDVGVMKGVIADITSDAHIIDITHNVAPQNVPSGAWILASAYRYFPKNTVYVCVVDPGVGSNRKAIAVHAGNWYFVGPDNGLFSYVIAEQPTHAAILLSNSAYHLPRISSTFHGRDIFAPVGAYLARGLAEIFHVGPATRREAAIDAHIVHVDNFGNLITSIPSTMVPELFTAPQVSIVFPNEGVAVEQRRRFFADGPNDEQPFIYGDSSGYVGIAVRNGNAAKALGVGFGANITFVTSTK
jgi:S-adenosyl-L-methionine hydrolase (adenosine-forming)